MQTKNDHDTNRWRIGGTLDMKVKKNKNPYWL